MSGTPRVLAVDDDEGLVSLLGRLLRRTFRERVCVTTMTDSVEARRWIEEVRPEVIITDLDMPEVDGFALSRDARRWNPSVQIIVLSGRMDKSVEKLAMSSGASVCFAKNRGLAEVLTAVDRALGSLHGSPSIAHELVLPADSLQGDSRECSAE